MDKKINIKMVEVENKVRVETMKLIRKNIKGKNISIIYMMMKIMSLIGLKIMMILNLLSLKLLIKKL